MARRLGGFVTGGLLVWAPLAALLGVLFSATAAAGTGLTPYLLAVMVFATGFTVPPARLAGTLRRPDRLIAALILQFGPLSLLAYLLSRLPLSGTVTVGILVLGAAPSEITSGLMVLLAEGDTALATALVGVSLLVSTLVTPALIALYAGGTVYVDRSALLQELALSVGLPLIGAVTLRSLLAGRGAQVRTAASLALWEDGEEQDGVHERLVGALDQFLPALAALAVIGLLFIVAGTSRTLLLSRDAFAAVTLCLLLNLAGYAAGWGLFHAMRAPERAVRAAVFTIGMREFGVAATVATTVLPAAAGVAGIYGVLILFTAPVLVRLYARGRPHPVPFP